MTKQYMTRDLYTGSWKDVLAKYEAMSNYNRTVKPKFVQEGSILKHIDKIAEILHKDKIEQVSDQPLNATHEYDTLPTTIPVEMPRGTTSRHYPVFEIVEVRTIRRACPTAEDVIKWRGRASDEELDQHVTQISYQITEVMINNTPPPKPVPVENPELISPVDIHTSIPMDIKATREAVTTTVPEVITTKIETTSPKAKVQTRKAAPSRSRRKPAAVQTATPSRSRRKVATVN